MRKRARILVIGSLNVDYIAGVERLPVPGETILAHNLIQRFGGKGANQAVAAARQGASVTMIGCVGDDDAGSAYRRRLQHEGIDASGISTTSRALTGTALIAVDRLAENLIIVAPGANGQLRPKAIRAIAPRLKGAAGVLLQFEIPEDTILETITTASRLQVPVFLNPSPMRQNFPWKLCALDTLIVNEHEAEAIFRMELDVLQRQSTRWCSALKANNIQRLVITRGAEPTICIESDRVLEIPTIKVKPIDTVGAGDAFAGAFVARRAEGADLPTAVRYANCAGALATLKPGAQESIPTRAATDRALGSARTAK